MIFRINQSKLFNSDFVKTFQVMQTFQYKKENFGEYYDIES